MPRVAAPPDVKESVLDAAARLMDRYGYKKMTMDAIAGEAGIGKATIYGYFENKEDVALSVMRRHQESVKARWHEIVKKETSPERCVREMLVILVLAGFDKAQRCRQSMDETLAALRHVILQRRYQFNSELASILAVVIQQGCVAGIQYTIRTLDWEGVINEVRSLVFACGHVVSSARVARHADRNHYRSARSGGSPCESSRQTPGHE